MHVTYRIEQGDALEVLATLPAESVQCVVTSPPYWGLRDYGVDGQIGLEPTPTEFVAKLVAVFREVRRVLRPDGVVFCNLGDSYAAQRGGTNMPAETLAGGVGGDGDSDAHRGRPGGPSDREANRHANKQAHRDARAIGLKHKDLCGMPWRVALALQDDGWYLRQDIIWHKPNPMPESVTDRCTKAHEYLFVLTKSSRYYWGAEAIKETSIHAGDVKTNTNGKNGAMGFGGDTRAGFVNREVEVAATRNARSVWTIATEPCPEAHFATFPRDLARRCIAAGTSEKGCCQNCGKPWVREVERSGGTIGQSWHDHGNDARGGMSQYDPSTQKGGVGKARDANGNPYRVHTLGWSPACDCIDEAATGESFGPDIAPQPVPCTVLDPFAGAGTTMLVSELMGRDSIGIELNPAYIDIAHRRIGRATKPGTYRELNGAECAPLFGTPTTEGGNGK